MAAPTARYSTNDQASERDDGANRCLLVLGLEQNETVALAAAGSLLIGRGEEADVRIVDGLASRAHARLHLGPPMLVEDLDSANGTRLGDRRVPPHQPLPLSVGEPVMIGATVVVVVVQRQLAPAPASPAGDGETAARSAGADVVLQNAGMRRLYQLAQRAARGTINVLISGETGVGKEVLAQAVHRLSKRGQGPFVCLNCAALSETLLESELFGHEKGAFTGAVQAKPGLLEAAAGGTLFLDEVGEMSLTLQAKVLRAIETRQVLRVGAVRPRPVDVRFVAASNRDLEQEVAARRFREDLYFRLAGITLAIPPLRERRDELPALAQLFLDNAARQMGETPRRLSREALDELGAYHWPGNIRELRNVMERAQLLATTPEITREHLPLERMHRLPGVASTAAETPTLAPLNLIELEKRAILDALARCSGNQTRAAALLGMPRRTLCKRLGAYNIPRPRT
jgi:two-component system, NtrC family, response regulator AtoC